MEMDLSNLLRISNSPQYPMLLHRKGQIEHIDGLFEVRDRDDAFIWVKRIIESLEAIEKSNFSFCKYFDYFVDDC